MNLMFKVKRREFVRCLVDLTSYAICYGLLEEAESLTRCLRQLRPRLEQLDLFDGWLAVLRCDWHAASMLAHAMVERGDSGPHPAAILAYSRFALGDPTWRATAQQVLRDEVPPDVKHLMKLLLGPLDPDSPEFFLNQLSAPGFVEAAHSRDEVAKITHNMVRA